MQLHINYTKFLRENEICNFFILYDFDTGWRDIDTPVDCQKFPKDVQSPHIPRVLHSMDCQDIIIGKVKGDLSNIGDYYTRDRSTPKRDEFYGGKDDLTAAVGWEENGITTIIFR